MNGLFRNVLSLSSATTLTGSARLTNFNPDHLLFYVDGGSSAVTLAELKKIIVTVNFKNSKGAGVSVAANLPLDMIANLNDYLAGNGTFGSETKAAFALDIGKICLRSDDEITLDISTATTLTNALSLTIKAVDSRIGKEQIISYKYVEASASQAYQQSDVLAVFAAITSPSDAVVITTDDYFGSNNVTEIAVCAYGAAFGCAENVDNFGPVWEDDTHLSQPVTVRAGSANERFLFKTWVFDQNRIGMSRTEFDMARNYGKSIAQSNPVKAKCLNYYYTK